MAIFRNFKNQSQLFMTLVILKTNHSNLWLYLGILKTNQHFMIIFKNFINQGITNHSKIKVLRYFGLRPSALASKTEPTK